MQWRARWIGGQREMAGRRCLAGLVGWRGRRAIDLRSKEFPGVNKGSKGLPKILEELYRIFRFT